MTKQIPLFYLKTPAIEVTNRIVLNNSLTWDWRSPLLSYLLQGKLPSDKNEARRIIVRAARFTTVGDDLYRHTFTGEPLLRCVSPSEANYVLREIHEVISELCRDFSKNLKNIFINTLYNMK